MLDNINPKQPIGPRGGARIALPCRFRHPFGKDTAVGKVQA